MIYSFLVICLALTSCQNNTESTASGQGMTAQSTTVPVKPRATAASQSHTTSANKMKWYTIEEVQALNEKDPKPILVDVYTDWCGWCKVMDRKTFANADVQAYIQENFYPVKFNAEQKSSH